MRCYLGEGLGRVEERLIEVVRGGRMMRGQEGEFIVVILQGGAAHKTR